MPFSGTLDDIRVYNRALSAGEIQAIFDIGNNPNPINLTNHLIGKIIKFDFPKKVEGRYLRNLKKVPTFIEDEKIKPALNKLSKFVCEVKKDKKE